MKLSGVKKEIVDVEISEREILEAAFNLIEKSLGFSSAFVRDGILMNYSYTHPHNGDDEYEASGEASNKQIEDYKFLQYLHKVIKDVK